MNAQSAADLVRGALMAAFWVGLPVMAAAFVAGFLLNLVQIVTSIQDPGFAAAPRLLAFLAAVVVFLPWMLTRLMQYATGLFSDFGRFAQ